VAKAVVKDIIRKDSLEAEIDVMKKNEKLLKANLMIKDSVIQNKQNVILLYQEKEKNFDTMLSLKDLQNKNLEDLTNTLKKDLRKAKRELKLTKIGGTVVIGALAYLILK
jgi:hypothetical protein